MVVNKNVSLHVDENWFRDKRDISDWFYEQFGTVMSDEVNIAMTDKELDNVKQQLADTRDELAGYEASLEEYNNNMVDITEICNEIMGTIVDMKMGKKNKQFLLDKIGAIKSLSMLI